MHYWQGIFSDTKVWSDLRVEAEENLKILSCRDGFYAYVNVFECIAYIKVLMLKSYMFNKLISIIYYKYSLDMQKYIWAIAKIDCVHEITPLSFCVLSPSAMATIILAHINQYGCNACQAMFPLSPVRFHRAISFLRSFLLSMK